VQINKPVWQLAVVSSWQWGDETITSDMKGDEYCQKITYLVLVNKREVDQLVTYKK
jgi:hypothetical protein